MVETLKQSESTFLPIIKNGFEKIALGQSTCRPPTLSVEQTELLLETITTRTRVPADAGFTARYKWTLAFIVEFVKEKWKVTYSLRRMSLLLERLGLSYTRPTYTLEKAKIIRFIISCKLAASHHQDSLSQLVTLCNNT